MKRIGVWRVGAGLILILLLSACGAVAAPTASEAPGNDTVTEAVESNASEGEVMKTDSGLQYIILEEGSGKAAQAGNIVRVHYTGTLEDGTVFDSSVGRDPIEFQLGTGQVIKGWDEGIALLKEGSKARLIIPPDLAYGDRAVGGVIPANSTLIFEVELVEVR
jgi:peptidylprolyl isomerase